MLDVRELSKSDAQQINEDAKATPKETSRESVSRTHERNHAAARKNLDRPSTHNVQPLSPHAERNAYRIRSHRPQQLEPSQYVIDLRKHYLIEKYKLDTIERPKKGIFSRFLESDQKPIRWHIPKTAPTSRHEEVEVEFFGLPVKYRALATFSVILLLALTPIPLFKLVYSLSAARQAIVNQGIGAFSNLTTGIGEIAGRQYFSAANRLASASNDFNEINRSIEQFRASLSHIISFIPSTSRKIKMAENLTLIGKNSAEIGALLAESLSATGGDASDRISKIRVRFKNIALLLEDSRGEILQLDQSALPQFRDEVQYVQANLDAIIDSAHRIETVLGIVYHIMGGDSLSRYLLVFQNSRELRPTGGFAGSYALIDFSRGSVKNIEFPGGGTYDLTAGFTQHLLPPQPLSLLNKEWMIWDANWWPDFPTSAKKIAWFYEQSGGATVDGVIAVNSDVMLEFLRALGPIEMPEYDVTITADNFYDVVQQEIEVNYDKALNQPKKILKDMMPRLMERLVAASNYRQLLSAMSEALFRKDIQISILNNPDLAQRVRDLGWDGALLRTTGDYLSVVSTNIAGGKSDHAIYETINHTARITGDGTITVTTEVVKEHRADPADPFAYVNNVDFLRFYVPLGSTLLKAAGFKRPDDNLFRKAEEYQIEDQYLKLTSGIHTIEQESGTIINKELGRTVFGNWLQTAPGERATASITYRLPFRITISNPDAVKWLNLWQSDYQEVDSYTLLVQKQAGRSNAIVNSQVVIDPLYHVVWSDAVEPEKIGAADQLITYSTDLSADTYYALVLARSRGSK